MPTTAKAPERLKNSPKSRATEQLTPKSRQSRERSRKPAFRTAREWAELGVQVQQGSGDLPRHERETTIAFIESESTAEVNTCRRDWQRRLENDGAKPLSIQTYEKGDAEFRWYIVPKSWIKRPYRSRASE